MYDAVCGHPIHLFRFGLLFRLVIQESQSKTGTTVHFKAKNRDRLDTIQKQRCTWLWSLHDCDRRYLLLHEPPFCVVGVLRAVMMGMIRSPEVRHNDEPHEDRFPAPYKTKSIEGLARGDFKALVNCEC